MKPRKRNIRQWFANFAVSIGHCFVDVGNDVLG